MFLWQLHHLESPKDRLNGINFLVTRSITQVANRWVIDDARVPDTVLFKMQAALIEFFFASTSQLIT